MTEASLDPNMDALQESGWEELRREARKIESDIDVKLSSYAKLGSRFTHGGNPENGMAHFWITDSCPETVKQVRNKSPFEVISLSAAIASALQI